LLDEFGHPILQLGAGPNEVAHDSSSRQVFLVHAQPFVSLSPPQYAHPYQRPRLFDRLIEGPHRGGDYLGSRLCREDLPPY
jgi:hypothetical protein